MSEKISLDEIDQQILGILQADARISNAALARQINLSPPATYARIKRLERSGLIKDYVTILNPEKLGLDMLCFVNISLQKHDVVDVDRFRKAVETMPEVLECYHITGEFDYLLKIVIASRKSLEEFLVDRLTPVPGVARIYTSLVLKEIKLSTALPVSSDG
jgi:DNA-binding Lrp family transcriptional regulator